MSKNDQTVFKLNGKVESTTSKIETIKNLIFGETIEAYDSEFEVLKKDILDKKKVLEDLVEQVRNDLNIAIDNIATDTNIRITEVEKNLENRIENLEEDAVNKKMLGKLLVELGEKVGKK
ncbi:fructose 1,6-bisphosphatase [Maribacter halichondriae]|uniref:fructose 1,6-bisphosphatase n=1 Tax=Maribacter halichondriae TaxID=2980554 RepID=UPI0023589746|nr:fructose 1,6-bisphosphatase [Maribacter sp. Hal144]